jgi:hypothetical protein
MSLNFGKINRAAAFDPTSAFPLDKRSYFESYNLACAAAQSAKEAGSSESVYYYGQTITVFENNEAKTYIIQPNGTLKEIANTDSIKIPTKVSQLENDSEYVTQDTFDENMQAIDGQISELAGDLESTDLTVTDNYNRLDTHETEINQLSRNFSSLTKTVNERFISRDVIYIATGADQATSNLAVSVGGGALRINLSKILYRTEWTILLEPGSFAGLSLETDTSRAYNIPYAHIRIVTPKKAIEEVSSEIWIPIEVNMVDAGQTEINILIVSNQVYAY